MSLIFTSLELCFSLVYTSHQFLMSIRNDV